MKRYYSVKNLNLQPEAVKDLEKSGLNPEIIQEAGILPATEEILEKYKIHYFDKIRRQKRFEALYCIPYLTAIGDEDKFCRVKVKPLPEYPDFDGKYTQPSKDINPFLKSNCHLYILPEELKKLQSPKSKILIAEGEKKTLKLIQESRKLQNEHLKYAVVGISGVNNWQTAPELKYLKQEGKDFYLFWDRDFEININVKKALFEMAGFLYANGGNVYFVLWDKERGKGIDDYLINFTNPEEELKRLLDNAKDFIETFKEDLNNPVWLETFLKEATINRSRFLSVLEDGLKAIGVKNKIIKNTKKTIINNLLKDMADKEIIDYELPPDFYQVGEQLVYSKKDNVLNLCTFFYVKDVLTLAEEDEDNEGYFLEFPYISIPSKRNLYIPVSNLNKKDIQQIFTRHSLDTAIDEGKASIVVKYITEFTQKNKFLIRRKRLFKSLGWHEIDGQKVYVLSGDEDFHIESKISKRIIRKGTKERELEFLDKLFKTGTHLSLGALAGFGSALIKILDINNFVISLEGTSGTGKTSTMSVAEGLFTTPGKLRINFQSTATGREIWFSTYKDMPAIVNEANTANLKDVGNLISNLIFGYEEGTGKVRANQYFNLRDLAEFRGILLISSENGIEDYLSEVKVDVRGTFRRTLSFNYSDYSVSEEVKKLLRTRDSFGNLIKDFTDYVVRNETEIIEEFERIRDEIKGRFKRFEGQENGFSLLILTARLINRVFGIDTTSINPIIEKALIENYQRWLEKVEPDSIIYAGKVAREIIKAMQEYYINFYRVYKLDGENERLKENNPKTLFGAILHDGDFVSELFIEHLARKFRQSVKNMKRLLVKYGIIEPGEGRILKEHKRVIAGRQERLYLLNNERLEELSNDYEGENIKKIDFNITLFNSKEQLAQTEDKAQKENKSQAEPEQTEQPEQIEEMEYTEPVEDTELKNIKEEEFQEEDERVNIEKALIKLAEMFKEKGEHLYANIKDKIGKRYGVDMEYIKPYLVDSIGAFYSLNPEKIGELKEIVSKHGRDDLLDTLSRFDYPL